MTRDHAKQTARAIINDMLNADEREPICNPSYVRRQGERLAECLDVLTAPARPSEAGVWAPCGDGGR